MSTETNKATIRRYFEEANNQSDLDVLKQLATPDYVDHNPLPGQGQGLAGLKQRAEMMMSAFRMQTTVEDMIASEDRVAVRFTTHLVHHGPFMGFPATGKSATIQGIAIHRMREGKIAERWLLVENVSLLMQLGVIPQPAAPGK